ncbi:hypothetical protein EDC01DRAFT_413114 [Geopyxis carbonaria]|nr:hypothetical protein EDC01DRAFT_413114 [Geopyxis carbonaria]
MDGRRARLVDLLCPSSAGAGLGVLAALNSCRCIQVCHKSQVPSPHPSCSVCLSMPLGHRALVCLWCRVCRASRPLVSRPPTHPYGQTSHEAVGRLIPIVELRRIPSLVPNAQNPNPGRLNPTLPSRPVLSCPCYPFRVSAASPFSPPGPGPAGVACLPSPPSSFGRFPGGGEEVYIAARLLSSVGSGAGHGGLGCGDCTQDKTRQGRSDLCITESGRERERKRPITQTPYASPTCLHNTYTCFVLYSTSRHGRRSIGPSTPASFLLCSAPAIHSAGQSSKRDDKVTSHTTRSCRPILPTATAQPVARHSSSNRQALRGTSTAAAQAQARWTGTQPTAPLAHAHPHAHHLSQHLHHLHHKHRITK